jgi:AraC-like DNA-binding protein
VAEAARAPYLFPLGAQIGADNVVLRARAIRHRVDGFAGPLSIKTVLEGRVAWIVGGRELVVDRSSFLILNAGETYSMNIDTPTPVATCCVFFAPGFVEKVALDQTSPLDQSLDSPERDAPFLPYLSAIHQDRPRRLAGQVHGLAPRCQATVAPSGFEEDFLLLADGLLQHYAEVHEQAARLPGVRESTRRELLRRLLRGQEYLHSVGPKPVSLRAAARAACVSPFHFHRGFTMAFGQTPHAYATALRLDRARGMIECGATVIEAALDAGFATPSSFSRAFRQRFGEPPSGARPKFARSGMKREAKPLRMTP